MRTIDYRKGRFLFPMVGKDLSEGERRKK